jgi:hypothetical protein
MKIYFRDKEIDELNKEIKELEEKINYYETAESK